MKRWAKNITFRILAIVLFTGLVGISGICILMGNLESFRYENQQSVFVEQEHRPEMDSMQGMAGRGGPDKKHIKQKIYRAKVCSAVCIGVIAGAILLSGFISHAAKGGELVREVLSGVGEEKYIKIAADVAAYHHEKWDGAGYPKGLQGEGIPLGARIMAVADVFDALVSRRCYKDAMPLGQAFDIIEADAGSHFDPTLAKLF